MIINWQEEITKIDPDIKFRAQGGWLKTIKELDKSVRNGYPSLETLSRQETLKANTVKEYISIVTKKEPQENLNKTTDYSASGTVR